MSNKSLPNYPGMGDEERFEAIMNRGRSLRRARTTKRASAFGGLGVVALAIGMFALVETSQPAQTSQVFANTAEVELPESLSPAVGESGALSLSIEQAAEGAKILVKDSAAAVALESDSPAQQCVTVTVRAAGSGATGVVLAEGFGCSDSSLSAPAATPIALTAVEGGVEVGCAATAVRAEPAAESYAPLSSTFTVTLPTGMAPGEVQMTVEAVSGVGDGCPGSSEGSNESEHSAIASGRFTL
ncbi:MAG: hypothetical protein WD029_07460 [Microthrixaceae bacterium]